MANYLSTHTGAEIDAAVDAVSNKQDRLVSGSNIKTINGQSILGTGDIPIESGGGVDYIVEEGTSGIWHYRKWNSGTGECWAYISKNSSGISEFTASTPFGLNNPAVTVSGGAASVTTSGVAYTNFVGTNTIDIYMNGNNSSTRLHWVRVHCIGVIKT